MMVHSKRYCPLTCFRRTPKGTWRNQQSVCRAALQTPAHLLRHRGKHKLLLLDPQQQLPAN